MGVYYSAGVIYGFPVDEGKLENWYEKNKYTYLEDDEQYDFGDLGVREVLEGLTWKVGDGKYAYMAFGSSYSGEVTYYLGLDSYAYSIDIPSDPDTGIILETPGSNQIPSELREWHDAFGAKPLTWYFGGHVF